ncbi:hypothetical protein QVD17_26092 [Tagetes erecta]|uniref:Uncharacterized protein n=1 Tax=Tagetes erecta TaxID=13708 RepID=A0AAD8NQ06_TARER|nr:hypothetical protein QVD17_26092 [Tagetes erecta]
MPTLRIARDQPTLLLHFIILSAHLQPQIPLTFCDLQTPPINISSSPSNTTTSSSQQERYSGWSMMIHG